MLRYSTTRNVCAEFDNGTREAEAETMSEEPKDFGLPGKVIPAETVLA